MDEQRIWHSDGSRYSKSDISSLGSQDSKILEQFKQWSTFETLGIIFESIQVGPEDIFQEKRSEYKMMRDSARKRGALKLDFNKDGVPDEDYEKLALTFTKLVRR